jgi:crotonobetainyl-CoA:carnitine CoA-transferase CaiB-like acyl-CoA transferase
MPEAGMSRVEAAQLADHVRGRDVEPTHALLGSLLAQRTARDWEAFFRDHEVPAAEALSPAMAYDAARDDAAKWPQIRLDAADGRTVSVPGPGFVSSLPLVPPLGEPPLRGAHTRETLRAAGLDDAAIAAALARGAAYEPARRERTAT